MISCRPRRRVISTNNEPLTTFTIPPSSLSVSGWRVEVPPDLDVFSFSSVGAVAGGGVQIIIINNSVRISVPENTAFNLTREELPGSVGMQQWFLTNGFQAWTLIMGERDDV